MTGKIRLAVNGVLMLGLLGALSLAAVGWQELPDAAVWGRLLIGSGLGATLGIVVMFFLPLELRANLTLAGTVSLAALWAASWALYEPARSSAELRHQRLVRAAREADVPFDARTPLEALEELRAAGVQAYPPLSPWSLFNNDSAGPALTQLPVVPLAGASRATTVLCNETGEHLIVETDRHGFNNPEGAYSVPSPALLLGDSFAFGYCVRPGRDLAGRLRAEGVDLLNLGYPGTGPLIQLAQLREYGSLVRPSAILWVYYNGNDITNLVAEYARPALRRYLDPEYRQGLTGRQAEIDAFWAAHVESSAARPPDGTASRALRDILLLEPLRVRARQVGMAFRAGKGSGTGPAPASPPDPATEQFDEVVEQVVAEAEKLGAPLYFVYLPTYSQFVKGNPRYRDDVLAAVRKRGVPIVDFEARLLATGEPLRYYPFGLHAHFNETGYALLVEQILDRLPLPEGGGAVAAAPSP